MERFMTKIAQRAYSHYAGDACKLLGVLIREARLEKRITIKELAERAGVSRGLITRAEKGDPGCAIGVVFELAAILGINLFNSSNDDLRSKLNFKREKLVLLPKYSRKIIQEVDDDF